MAFANLIFLILCATYVTIRISFQRKLAGGNKTHSRADWFDKSLVVLVGAGQVVIPAIYILTPIMDGANYVSASAQGFLGAVLYIGGLWLFWRSHHDLDTNWSVTLELEKNHTLITSGIYAYLRHPMYAAFFVMGFGQALLLSNWIAGFSASVSVLIMYFFRVPKEEKMMIDTFGEKYLAYMQAAGGIFPRIK